MCRCRCRLAWGLRRWEARRWGGGGVGATVRSELIGRCLPPTRRWARVLCWQAWGCGAFPPSLASAASQAALVEATAEAGGAHTPAHVPARAPPRVASDPSVLCHRSQPLPRPHLRHGAHLRHAPHGPHGPHGRHCRHCRHCRRACHAGHHQPGFSRGSHQARRCAWALGASWRALGRWQHVLEHLRLPGSHRHAPPHTPLRTPPHRPPPPQTHTRTPRRNWPRRSFSGCRSRHCRRPHGCPRLRRQRERLERERRSRGCGCHSLRQTSSSSLLVSPSHASSFPLGPRLGRSPIPLRLADRRRRWWRVERALGRWAVGDGAGASNRSRAAVAR